MKGRQPNKQEKLWMDSISQVGCIVCKLLYDAYTPAEIHHIDGKTKKASEDYPGCHLLTRSVSDIADTTNSFESDEDAIEGASGRFALALATASITLLPPSVSC